MTLLTLKSHPLTPAEVEAVRAALTKAMKDVDPQSGCDWLSSRGKKKGKVDLTDACG